MVCSESHIHRSQNLTFLNSAILFIMYFVCVKYMYYKLKVMVCIYIPSATRECGQDRQIPGARWLATLVTLLSPSFTQKLCLKNKSETQIEKDSWHSSIASTCLCIHAYVHSHIYYTRIYPHLHTKSEKLYKDWKPKLAYVCLFVLKRNYVPLKET